MRLDGLRQRTTLTLSFQSERNSPVSDLTQKITSVKQWIWLRRRKGIEPTADEIWGYLKKRWPTLDEQALESIFQGAN